MGPEKEVSGSDPRVDQSVAFYARVNILFFY